MTGASRGQRRRKGWLLAIAKELFLKVLGSSIYKLIKIFTYFFF